MKNICFFVTSLEPGGIETYLLRFLKHSDRKFKATVICKSGKTGALLEDYQAAGAKIITFKMGYFSPLNWKKLYAILRQNQYDAVCDFTGNFGGVTMLLASWAGISKRIVFYRHSSNHFKDDYFRALYNKWMHSLVYSQSTKILSNSAAALAFFYPNRHLEDSRFEVIRNGVDKSFYDIDISKQKARASFKLPLDAFIIGHTGRYNVAKNHKTFVEVAARLVNHIPNVHFVFAGRNTNNSVLQSHIEQLGLSSHFTILDHVRNVAEFLSTLDLFYFPSITEGQPNALIEAILVGVPIVSSNIEAIVESVPDFLHPYLIAPTDVEAATAVIRQRYQMPDIELDNKARQWAIENYDAELRFNQFINNIV